MESSRTPPRYVPTLTRVVEAGSEQTSLRPSTAPATVGRAGTGQSIPAVPATQPHAARPAATAEAVTADALTGRVMQRVELTLDRHLREATTQVALEFSRSMAQQMRPMIEAAVRNAVQEALDAERHR